MDTGELSTWAAMWVGTEQNVLGYLEGGGVGRRLGSLSLTAGRARSARRGWCGLGARGRKGKKKVSRQ